MEPKELEIIEEERGLFYLISLKGAFIARNILQIRSRIEYAMSLGHVNLALNLEETIFIDSTGLGLLVNVFKTTQKNGGQLILANPNPDIRKAFEISSLAKCLDIRYNIQDFDTLFD